FFFSSRRRHTRFSRDWSSDVCSSDLGEAEARFAAAAASEPPLDLLQYGHARHDPRARRRRRRLAVLAALALCSPVLVDGALALRDRKSVVEGKTGIVRSGCGLNTDIS